MAAGVVEGEFVGALMSKAWTSLTDMATKNIHFESELGALKAILQSVEPKVLEIEKHNNELGCAAKTKPHIDLLNKGKELVEKCSEISPLSFIGRSRYSDELTGYKAALLSFCQVELQLELSSDIKEMLVKLNQVSEVLDYVKGRSFVGKFILPGSTLTDAVIVPDELLTKDRPAVVLLPPGWFVKATSPEIQDWKDMTQNFCLGTDSKTANIKGIVPKLFETKGCQGQYEKEDEALMQFKGSQMANMEGIFRKLFQTKGCQGQYETEDEALMQFKGSFEDKYNKNGNAGTSGSGEGEESNPKKHEGAVGSGEGEEPSPKKHERTSGSGEGEEPSPKKHERTSGSGEGGEPSPKKPRKH